MSRFYNLECFSAIFILKDIHLLWSIVCETYNVPIPIIYRSWSQAMLQSK